MDKLFSMDLREHVVDAVVKSELSCHHAAVPTDSQCDAGQDRRHKPKAIAGRGATLPVLPCNSPDGSPTTRSPQSARPLHAASSHPPPPQPPVPEDRSNRPIV